MLNALIPQIPPKFSSVSPKFHTGSATKLQPIAANHFAESPKLARHAGNPVIVEMGTPTPRLLHAVPLVEPSMPLRTTNVYPGASSVKALISLELWTA